MNVADKPAVIEDEIVLTNGTGEAVDVDELDLEGLAQRADGTSGPFPRVPALSAIRINRSRRPTFR
jgi:hypothetical protein